MAIKKLVFVCPICGHRKTIYSETYQETWICGYKGCAGNAQNIDPKKEN